MVHGTKLLLIAGAGAITTASAVLFMTGAIPTPSVLYAVLTIAVLASATGVVSVRTVSPLTSRRSTLSLIVAFATGMSLATVCYGAYAYIKSLGLEYPRHGVVWPLFAVLFVATILIGVTAYAVATLCTLAVVGYRSRRQHLRPAA